MRPADDIKKIIKKSDVTTGSAADKRILDDALSELEKLKQTQSAENQPNIWRIIMKTKTTKFTAAAVIIIAVLVGLPLFTGDGSGVALADVLERIEQVQAFMYKTKATVTGTMMQGMPAAKTEAEGKVIISNEYGMKMETITVLKLSQEDQTKTPQQMYFLPDQKVMIMLMPDQKKYTRIEFDDEMIAKMKKQNNDPREMVKQIMRCEYTELGRSIIDGIEVEGFETTDPSFMAGMAKDIKIRLWVDVENDLPVRQESDIKVSEQMQMQMVAYDYQWDIQVDASEFEIQIPSDYSLLAEVEMPGMQDEGKTVQGLRAFAEIADGKYPSSMTMMAIIQESGKVVTSMGIDQTKEPTTEQTQQLMDKMMLLQAPYMFYTRLVQENKDPAYYGDRVTVEDAGVVLMRWKVSENEYRVIFGDLTTENVSSEQLAELEKLTLE